LSVDNNIGYICTGLQCLDKNRDNKAFDFIYKDLSKISFSFGDLDAASNKCANILKELGISKGDRVFICLNKSPELFFIFLGALKYQAVAGTLFPNFGEESLLDRLLDSKAKVVFTSRLLYKKLSRIANKLPDLKYIVLIDSNDDNDGPTLNYKKLYERASSEFTVLETAPDTPSVLHYTSGSTGKPKGVLHVHGSVKMQKDTFKQILCQGDNERYWCTADQGWVTGTSYGIIGPWSSGVSQVHYEGAFNHEAYMKILSGEKVTVWYTAPTLLRMLMNQEDDFFKTFDFSNLKQISSVGEPLNPEIISWSKKIFGMEIYDTWFQTETGSIMISNRPGLKIKPGSMGKPVNSAEAVILSQKDLSKLPAGEIGHLCLKKGWPSMFVSYLNNEAAYEKKFAGDHYFTGDLASVDEEGYFWFTGRSDDVINTAGHLISPFEIESALLEFPQIAESAAIAVPDPTLFETIVVFVKLNSEVLDMDELKLKIRLYISNRVSTIATPKDIIFTDNIPKNKSGKIMRRYLKAKYLNTDTGDISTLEDF